jgi:hypothetical protein
MKADVYMKAWGLFMKNSDYRYFYSEWNNITSESITELFVDRAQRTLGGFYHPTWTAKYNVTINITLRTDIMYDLEFDIYGTDIFISNNILINDLILTGYRHSELNVNATSINNIEAASFWDTLTLVLTNCNINDNINILSTTGDINFVSNNSKSRKNVEWNFFTEEGSINTFIYQSEEIGANITAFLFTTLGNINVKYIDNLSNIEAFFTTTVTNSLITTNLGGFEEIGNNIFRSTDFDTVINTFNFSLTTIEGISLVVGLSS